MSITIKGIFYSAQKCIINTYYRERTPQMLSSVSGFRTYNELSKALLILCFSLNGIVFGG
jgi:hypothetical protein